MSEANKNLARRWFEEVWNQGSEAAIEAMFNPEGKCYGFPGADSVLVGPEAFKQIHRDFCRAFPDQHITIEDVIAEGDRVTVRWRATMTHLGGGLGLAPSGKKASITGASFIVVRDGQITEGWNQVSIPDLLQQLQ